MRDAELFANMAQLVEGRPSRGIWKCRKQLWRQGQPWKHVRICPVYKLINLNLHLQRSAKKRLPKRHRAELLCTGNPPEI